MADRLIYCLRCIAPLPGATDLRTECPQCGHHNFGADRRRYWNQLPAVCTLERALKGAVVVATVVALWFAFLAGRHLGYRSVALYLFVPTIVGFELYRTVGLLTRRLPTYAAILWSVVLALAGAVLCIAGQAAWALPWTAVAIAAVWTIAWVYRGWRKRVEGLAGSSTR